MSDLIELTEFCTEIVGNNFESGALGPGTIVGSAAFNLMCISAVCIVAIPGVETRKIKGNFLVLIFIQNWWFQNLLIYI